jgi:polyphosphate kinase
MSTQDAEAAAADAGAAEAQVDGQVTEAAATTPPDAVPVPAPRADGSYDLRSPAAFLNRELTWLNFNFRVLHEAEDERNPLLERVKFVSIVGSNLDEFIMKRIGGLKQQVGAGIDRLTGDGRSPQQQIDECNELVRRLEARQRRVLDDLVGELAEHDIVVTTLDALDEEDRGALRQHYLRNVFPLVTPQATDPAHPFPFVSNLSLNLLVTVRHPGESMTHLARVKVPLGAGCPRFLKLEDRDTFVTLESVMAGNLDLLFPGMEIESCELFRVTRNANTEVSEEHADDLLSTIETGLRERKFAPIVRLEVGRHMTPDHRGMLAAELGLDETADVFEVDGMMSMRHMMEILQVKKPALRDAPHHPADHPLTFTDRSLFHVVREQGSMLLHHPYQAFSTSVERLLREASRDPKVRAIKMTIYRMSEDERIIGYLVDAARNGKQVAVVVELKARFDEEANIKWAKRLEDVGIHVTYGVVGLKTHCKAIMVVRSDYDALRRYVHVGTGNYHTDTARLYCDLGMITCDEVFGQDYTELFNYLTTGYKPKRNFQAILPAPKILKPALLAKIAREVAGHSEEAPGLIQLKANALTDADVIRALYDASQAGVQVEAVVRDSCRLRPGVPGLSENIRVVSVVGRFLEHARVWYFLNGGDEEYYMGSADAMKRNLEARVEVLAPVTDPKLREDLRTMLDLQLEERRGAWEMRPDGSYVLLRTGGPAKDGVETRHSQEILRSLYRKRLKSATRLKHRKPRGIAGRNIR